MLIQTDLKKITYYAGKNDKINWRFRSFLKTVDKSMSELDRIVHGINEEVTAKIDCTTCANCCKKMSPLITKTEARALAAHLRLSPRQFIEQYMIYSEGKRKYSLKELPCIFLKDYRCQAYEVRPKDCRSFPHLWKKEFVFRLIGVVENYAVCPIVFNVYERLKERFGFTRE
jgi:hypothetical protein